MDLGLRERVVLVTGSSRGIGKTYAADCGYSDQAHMIAELEDLLGATPEAFVRAASSRERW